MAEKKRTQVACPYCGYRMPVFHDEDAFSNGVYLRCKGRNCKRKFEIKINRDK